LDALMLAIRPTESTEVVIVGSADVPNPMLEIVPSGL
jgi:hypothetical protein